MVLAFPFLANSFLPEVLFDQHQVVVEGQMHLLLQTNRAMTLKDPPNAAQNFFLFVGSHRAHPSLPHLPMHVVLDWRARRLPEGPQHGSASVRGRHLHVGRQLLTYGKTTICWSRWESSWAGSGSESGSNVSILWLAKLFCLNSLRFSPPAACCESWENLRGVSVWGR
jgi:hypothetical protein